MAMTKITLVSDSARLAQPRCLRCFALSHWPLTIPFSPRAARLQMKRIVVSAFILYIAHVDSATIHVTGPDHRQIEFGDGTNAFATLSGGEWFLNSTVTVNAPNFVTVAGVSLNEMIALIRDQQVAIIAQQAEIEALKHY